MADIALAERRQKQGGRKAAAGNVTLTAASPASRLALRAPEPSLGPLSRALGMTLPTTAKTSATSANRRRHSLWLGPDEWLVIDENGADLVAECATSNSLCSAVDVSHRNVAILVDGVGAAACINAGCPQDLSLETFPAGGCSRTVLGKIEVVLFRTAETAFRVEVWRSFSDYAWDFLEDAARDS
ncbi:sarcosine oxidase subunit gamma family protein [Aquibium carbonis]|uniref:Sarcosine oxidase subunit gamma family protein n=1 Tax=Aquibium carbonis TaxID=2495581 RepID=A0A3R9Y7D8_9HYPH|nr:sarcosine oxidase subunit gamma [Aquibium carbonis]RST85807.1 sarcosine oxidase subunit gamma family protein [Aquibium carbonis]